MNTIKEKEVVSAMIKIYCKGSHHSSSLCEECQKLADYAFKRIELCPFQETKSFCSQCKVHCYDKQMREKIKTVMKYSGPRILFHHPILLLKHGIASFKKQP